MIGTLKRNWSVFQTKKWNESARWERDRLFFVSNARYRPSGSIRTSVCTVSVGGPRSPKSGYFFFFANRSRGTEKFKKTVEKQMPSLPGAVATVIKPPDARHLSDEWGAPATIPPGPRAAASPGWFIRSPPRPRVRGDSIIRHRHPSPAHRARACSPPLRSDGPTRTPAPGLLSRYRVIGSGPTPPAGSAPPHCLSLRN